MSTIEIGIFWLLLPISALIGSYFGYRAGLRGQSHQAKKIRSHYLRGLNYLLNEEDDKALASFLEIPSREQETFEMQLVLGSLLRQRGEVDRAIHIHQTLVIRSNIKQEQKIQALLALGEDYLHAGLLDRAEAVFSDVLQVDAENHSALQSLLKVSQQERDWLKAITYAQALQQAGGESQQRLIAQYCCELAEVALAQGEEALVQNYLQAALQAESECARALFLHMRLAKIKDDCTTVLQYASRIVVHHVNLVSEVLPMMLDCYAIPELSDRVTFLLDNLVNRYPGIAPDLVVAQQMYHTKGATSALNYLVNQLQKKPSILGLQRLVEWLWRLTKDENSQYWPVIYQCLTHALENKISYRCGHCGFSARANHWQCPSCKSWDTMKYIAMITIAPQ